MKKTFFITVYIYASISLYAQKTIDDVLRQFDNVLFTSQSTTAQTAIGYITYADTDTSGTVAEWFQQEIKTAADKTRRIKIISSSQLNMQEQIILASRGTRSPKFGMKIPLKKSDENKYTIDGIYREKNGIVELQLTLSDDTRKKISSETASFSLQDIQKQGLTLYPKNMVFSQTVQKDFEKAAAETSNGKITIVASMIDTEGNLVNILHPGDNVRFVVYVDSDAYIAIQGIDAEKDSYWLPVNNPHISAGETRIFPDGDMEYQVIDGVFGAEHLIIHASSSMDGLPNQNLQGLYTTEMINKSRGIGAVKNGKNIQGENLNSGLFKISYTVVK